jgi:hypothetical protein
MEVFPMVIGFAFEKSWLCPIKSGGFEKSEPPLFSVLAAIRRMPPCDCE